MQDDPQPNNNKNIVQDSKLEVGGNLTIGDTTYNITYPSNPLNLTDYQARIRNFFDEYLGTPTATIPFGGRGKELESLDNWLTDPKAPPYALIAAEAGRGKSALLTHWTTSIIGRDLASVVSIPVSIRFNTALSSVFFPTLAASLAEIFGETLTQFNRSAEQWRSECLRYMQKSPPEGKPLLIIIDGLDEAIDWKVGPDLFPTSPPPGLHVLVSARYVEGDVDEQGWLRRLGWGGVSKALSILLPPLTRQGVSDVLTKMGNPLSSIGTQVDLVAELYRLSQGDPLLVRLYVDALLPYNERAAALQPGDLPSIKKGLAGYFERWWDDQTSLSKGQGSAALQQEDVKNFFNICATAIGPLGRDDVLAVLGGERLNAGLRLKDITLKVGRFILGDGNTRGYVFSHPRLGQFFWDQMPSPEQTAWEGRFLAYGRATLDALLNKEEPKPQNPSPYIMQYYGAHLERSGAPAKDLYALVTEEWLQAWKAFEGTFSGFLNDVNRAQRRAESATPALAAEDLVTLIKCTLCRTSVTAQSSKIPPKLLVLSVQYHILSPLQALNIARLSDKFPEALELLAPTLPLDLMEQALLDARAFKAVNALIILAQRQEEALKTEILKDALQLVQAIPYEDDRAKALIFLGHDLPETLAQAAVAIVEQIKNPRLFVTTLIHLSASFQAPLRMQVRQKALDLARAIQDEKQQVELFAELLPNLPDDLKADLVQEAFVLVPKLLTIYESDRSEQSFAELLNKLAPYLPEAMQPEMLKTIRSIKNQEAQVIALTGLFPHLPEPLQSSVLPEILQVVRAVEKEYVHANALIDLIPYLPEALKPEILREALQQTRAINDVERRPMALSLLVPFLPEEWFAEVLDDVWKEHSWAQASILTSLAPHLSDDLLGRAFQTAKGLKEEKGINALIALIPFLPESFQKRTVQEILEALKGITNEHSKKEALIELAPYLAENLLDTALEIGQYIPEKKSIDDTLIEIIVKLPQERMIVAATEQALSAAQAIQDKVELVGVEVALAKYLATAKEPLMEILKTVHVIEETPDRAHALASLVPYLPTEIKEEEASKALGLIDQLPLFQRIWTSNPRAKVLATLAPHLPESLMSKALELARPILDNESKLWALTGLAPYLPEALKENAIQEALELSKTLKADEIAYLLVKIIHLLPPWQNTAAFREELLDSTLLTHIDNALSLLIILGPHLQTTALLKKAQKIAWALDGDNYRIAAYVSLFPYLSDTEEIDVPIELLQMLFSETELKYYGHPKSKKECIELSIALLGLIEFKPISIEALTSLAPHLPDKLKAQAIQAALSVLPAARESKNAFQALAPLLPEWAQHNPNQGFFALKDLLRHFSTLPRPSFLPFLQLLLPLAFELANAEEKEKAATGIFRAIQDVGKWWP